MILRRRTAIAGASIVATLALLMTSAAQPAGMRMVMHDRLEIAREPIDGLMPRELSGLAWDADEQLLYAVSDKGIVFHFRIALDDAKQVRELAPVYAARLTTAGGADARFNAEGLDVVEARNGRRGDTQLVVALENGPRIMRHTPQGRALGEVVLPAVLRDPAAYRSDNDRLESVSSHPRYGLVTAPQRPLKGRPGRRHQLYATDGSRWSYPALERTAIKAIESLDDGRLLILERRRGKGPALLRLLDLSACTTPSECPAGEVIGTTELDTGDNFEGLARLGDKLYAVVSDGGPDAARGTMLVLFGLEPR